MAGDIADGGRVHSYWTSNIILVLFLAIYASAFWWAKDISPTSALILGFSLGGVMIVVRLLSAERFPFDRMTGWMNVGTMIFLAAQAYDHFFFPRGAASLLGDNMMIFGCSAGAFMLAGLALFHFRLIK
jgi:hypothetical protein